MTDTINLDRFVDLAEKQEEGIDLPLVDEVGNPVGLTIHLVGPDSKRARQAMKEVAAEFAKKAETAESMAPSVDDGDERTIAYLSKISTGWHPVPQIGGKEVSFSEENALNFFTRFRMFREQAEFVAVRRGPFAVGLSPASATSSKTSTTSEK